jgi:hypothetical protein
MSFTWEAHMSWKLCVDNTGLLCPYGETRPTREGTVTRLHISLRWLIPCRDKERILEKNEVLSVERGTHSILHRHGHGGQDRPKLFLRLH